MRLKPLTQKKLKVVLAHDFFNQYGGGERVIESLAEIWPEANIYTSLYDAKLMEGWLKIDKKRIKTNLISRLPFASYLDKHYFFLYAWAFSRQELEEAAVALSVTSYPSKFIKGQANTLRICYINTVPRFLWGYDTELSRYYRRGFDRFLAPIYSILVPPIKFFLRRADYNIAQKIDYFIANSHEVASRVKKHYNREADIIYPPVDINRFGGKIEDKGYFLIVSRLGGYKKIDVAVAAFNKLGERLKIVGAGPQLSYLRSIAAPNVEFLGRLADKKVVELYKNCTAVIFPTYEDFGIVPVEAQAAGKPVIAFRAGGALETIVDGKTGIFFDEQKPESLQETVKKFKLMTFDPETCRQQASKFSKGVFQKKIKDFVMTKYLEANRGKVV